MVKNLKDKSHFLETFLLTVNAHMLSGILVSGLAEKSTVSSRASILILSGIRGMSLRDKFSSTSWLNYKFDNFFYKLLFYFVSITLVTFF